MKLYIQNQEQLEEGKYASKDIIDKVIFGSDVNYIPENCFNGCNNLKEIIFEGNINNIEPAAFMNCNNLQTINVNDINIIKDFAFHGCKQIIDFNIKEDLANNIKYGINNDILSQYFLLPKIGTSLNDISWLDIHKISKQDKAKNYFKVGDEKEFIIAKYSFFEKTTETTIIHPKTTYHIQILDFNQDDKSDGTGKAGITFGLKEVMISMHNMNYKGRNIGSWKNSEMRTYVNRDVYNNLSQEVKNVIKPVDKSTSKGNNIIKTEITSDKLFLLSESEISNKLINSASGEGKQYKYFINNNSKIKYKIGLFHSQWWNRSPNINNNYHFSCIDYKGNINYNVANSTYGVVFAFCV